MLSLDHRKTKKLEFIRHERPIFDESRREKNRLPLDFDWQIRDSTGGRRALGQVVESTAVIERMGNICCILCSIAGESCVKSGSIYN